MPSDNQISVVIPDATVTAMLGHFTAIQGLLLASFGRVKGQNAGIAPANQALADTSVGFITGKLALTPAQTCQANAGGSRPRQHLGRANGRAGVQTNGGEQGGKCQGWLFQRLIISGGLPLSS